MAHIPQYDSHGLRLMAPGHPVAPKTCCVLAHLFQQAYQVHLLGQQTCHQPKASELILRISLRTPSHYSIVITYAHCTERVPCVNPAGPWVPTPWALAGYFPLPQTSPGTLLLGQLQDYEAIFPL